MAKKLLKNFMGITTGVPLISATASMVNELPAGTAKTISGTAVGLSSVGLVKGLNMKPKSKPKGKKIKWL